MPTPLPEKTLASRILEKIGEDRVTVRPRWEFLFKNYVFWFLGTVAVLLGAVAFSAAIFEVENAGWQYFSATHGDFVTFFFAAAPFLWAAALLLFVALGYVNIRRTSRGYRYPLAVIALGAILTSVTLGTALYVAGYGGDIEEVIGDHPPFYRPVLAAERSWWSDPEKGLLGGVVISVAPDTASFTLKDFSGQVWTIDSTDVRGPDLVALLRGGSVRIAGVPMPPGSTSPFHACFVFPWHTFGVVPNIPGMPFFFIASTSEKILNVARSEECRSIGSYKQLHALDRAGL